MVNVGAIVACQMACNVAVQNALRLQQEYEEKNKTNRENENKQAKEYNHKTEYYQ